jgi:hypothetical protein
MVRELDTLERVSRQADLAALPPQSGPKFVDVSSVHLGFRKVLDELKLPGE